MFMGAGMNLVPQIQESVLSTPAISPPYKLADWQIKCISKALVEAWRIILQKNMNILDQQEPFTTIDICEELGQLQADEKIAGFTHEHFETPNPNIQRRSAPNSRYAFRNYDFVLRPLGKLPGVNKQHYGMVVECKLLKKKTNSLLPYVADGMHRFIHERDYAEYMAHAMMLAYSDGTFSFPTDLVTYFNKSRAKKVSTCFPLKSYSIDNGVPKGIFVTCHDRPFKLQNNVEPGPIDLYHIWLTPDMVSR